MSCGRCINGLGQNPKCPKCGRGPDYTLRVTGRYLNPMRTDLARIPWSPLRVMKYGEGYGYVFDNADRSVPPEPGTPHLYTYPGPYHPIEMLMAQRGWGGAYGQSNLTEGLHEIFKIRESPFSAFVAAASKWLHWPANTVNVLFQVFTPTSINSGPDLADVRKSLGISGVHPPLMTWGSFPLAFWGGLVKGVVEL